jgi:uncharacterized protein (DUF1697 family)
MPVLISLLRAINVGGNRMLPMERLRVLCDAAGCRDVRTYVQSGNAVFKTADRNPANVARRLEAAIQAEFGFHSEVIVRTIPEWKDVIAANPFANRAGIEPAKLLVTFLGSAPTEIARQKVLALATGKEELHLLGREMYIYFHDGLARPKLNLAAVGKALGVSSTGRNWNTVLKLLEIAESL